MIENKICCGIYKITSPSGRIYIGQAKNIYKRWEYSYKNLKCKGQILLYNSFLKYGVENHKFDIICQCEENQLNYLEAYLIRYYDTFDTSHGLNLTSGGDRYDLSKESRKKIAEKVKKNHPRSFLNRKHTEESKKIMSEKQLHRFMTEKVSDETKRKIGKKSKGRGAKIIYQLDKYTEEILNEFPSMNDVFLIYKIGVSGCANGKRQTSGGYKWKFKIDMPIEKIEAWEKQKIERENKYINFSHKATPKNQKMIYQIDKNTDEILNEFESLKIAKNILGITNMSRIHEKNKTAGGYKWALKEKMSLQKIKEWDDVKYEKLSMIF